MWRADALRPVWDRFSFNQNANQKLNRILGARRAAGGANEKKKRTARQTTTDGKQRETRKSRFDSLIAFFTKRANVHGLHKITTEMDNG